MSKEKKNKSYTCFSGRKEQFLDHFKELRDENKVFLKLAVSPEDLRIWLRSDKDFKLQYESYKNSAKHKLRASILAKALQGSVTRTFVEGVVVKEVHYTDPAMVKLAHQIINADDFDNVKNHLPEEIKVNFV